jgi:hypothetical protein
MPPPDWRRFTRTGTCENGDRPRFIDSFCNMSIKRGLSPFSLNAKKGPHERAFRVQAGLALVVDQQLALLFEQVTHLVVFKR